MKSIQLTFHEGKNAPQSGMRIVPIKGRGGFTPVLGGGPIWSQKSSSEQISKMFRNDVYKNRKHWAQLVITIDEIDLSFWLPEELDHVCEVFRMVPFPTALNLVKQDPQETRLNGHWLSRLPKKAKSKKFRDRFLKFVLSDHPEELLTFRSFYAS